MNVILILLDTVRRDFLGCYGNELIQTPNIDRLASRSVVFDHAYTGSFPCMPARRDLWTGRFEFPWRGWGPLENDDDTLPGRLTRAGHRSMLVTDHFHLWERGSGNYHMEFTGVEFIRGQERDMWITDDSIPVDWPASKKKLAGHFSNPEETFATYRRNTAHFRYERDYFAPQVMQRAMDWLEGNYQSPDFFLLIDCFDPHEPFDVPEPYRSMYRAGTAKEQIMWPNYGATTLVPEEIQDVRALYAGLLTMVDRWVGRLVDKIEQLSLMKDTAIILMTDHGHLFGEHGLMGKPWAGLSDSNLYQELAHIPLMIYHPEATPHRVSGYAQAVDLYPTILEWLNVPYEKEELHGRSLAPWVLEQTGPKQWRDVVCYGRFGEALNVTDSSGTLMQWYRPNLVTSQFWYGLQSPRFQENIRTLGNLQDNSRFPVRVTRGSSVTSVYASSDSDQTHNLVGTSTGEQLQQQLKGKLRSFLESVQAPTELIEQYDL